VKSDFWFPLIYAADLTIQVFLSKERHLNKGTFSTNVVELRSRTVVIEKPVRKTGLCFKAGEGSTFYTDGSWANIASLGNQFIGNNCFRAGGAVVEKKADGSWVGYATTCDQGMFLSAFDMELMMLLFAIDMRTSNQTIRSDCTSAIKVTKDGIWGWNSAKGNVLRAAAAKLKGITDIMHIDAHPERLKDRNCWAKWTEDERGIYLADLLAGGNHERFWQLTNTVPIMVESSDILKMCADRAGYCLYWDNGKGATPFCGSLSELTDHVNLLNYTKEREAHHDKNEQAR
jgi:hypothetical protein